MTNRLLLACVLLAAACDRDDEICAPPRRAAYMSQQGTRAAGGKFTTNSFPHDAVGPDRRLYADLRIVDGELRAGPEPAPLRGTELVGFEFDGQVDGAARRFSIARARPHQSIYATFPLENGWEYEVKHRDPSVEPPAWAPLCRSGSALPEPGVWKNGVLDAAKQMSFVCVPSAPTETDGSVAAKCTDWGYRPWAGGKTPEGRELIGTTAAGGTIDATRAVELHVACVHMAMADYCVTGHSATVDGTPIDMYNGLDIGKLVDRSDHVAATSGSGLAFEAAWSSKGAICLTKQRWATIPPDACNGATNPLPDPRNQKAGPGAKFCEEMTEHELEAANAVLFSFSRYIDAGLWLLQRGDDGHTFHATSRVVSPGAAGDHRVASIDDAGYTSGGFTPMELDGPSVAGSRFLGSLIAPDVQPGDVLVRGSKPLFSYLFDDGRFVTTTDRPPRHYTTCHLEGLVFESDDGDPRREKLSLYRRPDGHGNFDYATATTPPADFTLVRPEGYLLRGANLSR